MILGNWADSHTVVEKGSKGGERSLHMSAHLLKILGEDLAIGELGEQHGAIGSGCKGCFKHNWGFNDDGVDLNKDSVCACVPLFGLRLPGKGWVGEADPNLGGTRWKRPLAGW